MNFLFILAILVLINSVFTCEKIEMVNDKKEY